MPSESALALYIHEPEVFSKKMPAVSGPVEFARFFDFSIAEQFSIS
jgi:hypothetical protein